MRLVPLNCVKEGTYLGKHIYDIDGRILLKKGVELNQSLIKRIMDVGIQTIYINDEYSSNEIEDIIKPEIRMKAVKTVKDTFESIQRVAGTGNTPDSSSSKSQLVEFRDELTGSVSSISNDIVNELLSKKNILINLVDIKTIDNYTYLHSVNVAILSLVLGIELGLAPKVLHDLCIGALLHDVGKAFIPKEILNKYGKLTPKEFDIMKQHTVKGYEYVKSNVSIPAAAKVVILQHHERIDGTGYPRAIKDLEIHTLAKVVAITDTYDELTSDRPYRKAVPPNEAIELMMGCAGRYFDFEMVQTFVRKVIPYPVGTLVKLSNGEYAVVEEVKPNFPLRPSVRIIRQRAVNVELENVDLLTEKNLVIEGIQYEEPNLSIPHYLKNA